MSGAASLAWAEVWITGVTAVCWEGSEVRRAGIAVPAAPAVPRERMLAVSCSTKAGDTLFRTITSLGAEGSARDRTMQITSPPAAVRCCISCSAARSPSSRNGATGGTAGAAVRLGASVSCTRFGAGGISLGIFGVWVIGTFLKNMPVLRGEEERS